jgi:hypothetical protein
MALDALDARIKAEKTLYVYDAVTAKTTEFEKKH